MSNVIRRTLAVWLLAGVLPVARAQKQGPVLRAGQVTESALIEALAIDAPQAPDGQTRGFGVVKNAPLRQRQSEARTGGGKASLLMTFDVDSAELTAETTAALDTVARALQSDQLAGFSFRIEGHADPRGGAQWNQRLSQQRAASVVDYLVRQHGILPERLTPVGKGDTELLDRARPTAPVNRRVTIVTQRG